MKKIFYIVMITLLGNCLYAQTNDTDAVIDASQIKYWVGNGSNEVVFAVNWANPDTCLAWGYRFSSDSINVAEIISGIAAADSRFSYDSSMGQYGAYMQDIRYVPAAGDTFKLSGMYWMYNVNGLSAMNSFDQQFVKANDFVKFGDESAGTITDSVMYTYIWTTTVTPVDAPQSIVRISEIQLNVFPNPAHDQVFISLEENQTAALILTDMQGKILKRRTITGEGTISVSDLAAGMYLLRLQNENGIAVRKLNVR